MFEMFAVDNLQQNMCVVDVRSIESVLATNKGWK